MMKNDREFDVIVWGASGFTGRLVAEYLSSQYGVNRQLRWAMGGRNARKLETVAQEVGAAGVAIVSGDAADPSSLGALAARARVVCTTVGPYQKYGSALVAACVEAGTDYVDLSGEPPWMRRMMDQHHGQAQQTGARIVHSCGFDSIPFDMGVYFLQQAAKAKFGEPCVEVKGRMKAAKGKPSGGTVASMIATIESRKSDPLVAKVMGNPFGLAVDKGANRPRQPDGNRPHYDEDAESWVGPFIMAAINVPNVHRTNMLMEYAYGQDFLYSEMMMAKSRFAAMVAAGGLGVFAGALGVGPLRALLRKFALPEPGEGPNAHERETGFYDVRFFGRTKRGDKMTVKVRGDRDPGYGSTSKMIGEAAVCMARDIDVGASGGGFWTPASAMGRHLIDRLTQNAGVTFDVL